MSALSFTVTDHEISCSNLAEFAQGSHNYDTVSFETNWGSGYTLSAYMQQPGQDAVLVPLTNGSCGIPINALGKEHKLYIGLYGIDGSGNIATSKLMCFSVYRGAISPTSAALADGTTYTRSEVNAIIESIDQMASVGFAAYNAMRQMSVLNLTASGRTVSGVIFSVNPDGSVKASGTAGSDVSFPVGSFQAAAGDYAVSGCPAGGGDGSYKITVTGAVAGSDTGSGAKLTAGSAGQVSLSIFVAEGTTVNHVFCPLVIKI